MASRKRTSTTKKKSSRKPKTPAHPDLGKEFYVATDAEGNRISHYDYQGIDSTKADALSCIEGAYYEDINGQRECKVYKVRIVEVGVDESEPNADNRTWYK